MEEFGLAQACLSGDQVALNHLNREFLCALEPIVQRVCQNASERDDVLQLTRLRLLVGDGRPRLAEYHGRGSLMGWLKMVTTRLALNERAQRGAHETRERYVDAAPDVSLDRDPTLLLLRQRHAVDFDAALRTGWATLTAQQRTILKMSTLDGLSIDRIAAVFGTHRTTAFRWLERARADLLDSTRQALASRLAISGTELESLLRGLDSELGVSLRTIMLSGP